MKFVLGLPRKSRSIRELPLAEDLFDVFFVNDLFTEEQFGKLVQLGAFLREYLSGAAVRFVHANTVGVSCAEGQADFAARF